MYEKAIILLAAGALALGACSSDSSDDASPATTGDSDTTAAVDTPTTAAEDGQPAGGPTAVAIVDFAFDPDPIDIAAGDTITWTNEDGFAHTVTAKDASAVDFDSGDLDEGATFEMSFDEAGEYAYFCAIHNQMQGTVLVS